MRSSLSFLFLSMYIFWITLLICLTDMWTLSRTGAIFRWQVCVDLNSQGNENPLKTGQGHRRSLHASSLSGELKLTEKQSERERGVGVGRKRGGLGRERGRCFSFFRSSIHIFGHPFLGLYHSLVWHYSVLLPFFSAFIIIVTLVTLALICEYHNRGKAFSGK